MPLDLGFMSDTHFLLTDTFSIRARIVASLAPDVCHKNDGVLRLCVVAGVIVVLKAIQSHHDPWLRPMDKGMAASSVRQVAHRDT